MWVGRLLIESRDVVYDVRMPKGLVRYQESGNLHFVTFSCYARRPYLNTPRSKDLFERALEKMRLRYDFFVTGYVLMPEHVHILLSEPKKALLSKAIQALKLSVSVKSTERPFWQHRYYDFNVFTREKVFEKLNYMHENPVTRGLVGLPESWKWSSARHYASGQTSVIEIESSWTASRRDRAATNTHVSEARHGAPIVGAES